MWYREILLRALIPLPHLSHTPAVHLSNPDRVARTEYNIYIVFEKSIRRRRRLFTGGKRERTAAAEAVGRDVRERCKNDKLVRPRVTPVSAFPHKEHIRV